MLSDDKAIQSSGLSGSTTVTVPQCPHHRNKTNSFLLLEHWEGPGFSEVLCKQTIPGILNICNAYSPELINRHRVSDCQLPAEAGQEQAEGHPDHCLLSLSSLA